MARCRFRMASRPGKNTSLTLQAIRIPLGNTGLRLCSTHLGHALNFELCQTSQGEHPYFLKFASRERFEEMHAAGRAVVVLDLNMPLGEQLRKAKKELKKVQADCSAAL